MSELEYKGGKRNLLRIERGSVVESNRCVSGSAVTTPCSEAQVVLASRRNEGNCSPGPIMLHTERVDGSALKTAAGKIVLLGDLPAWSVVDRVFVVERIRAVAAWIVSIAK